MKKNESGGGAVSRAAAFQEQLEARRHKRAVEITLLGFTFLAQRPDLEQWLLDGRLPDSLTTTALQVFKNEGLDQVDAPPISREVLAEVFELQRMIICDVVVDPKIVLHANPGPDEISLLKMPSDLRMAIFQWALSGSPGVPVPTQDGGETSIEALDTFHPQKRRSKPHQFGPDF